MKANFCLECENFEDRTEIDKNILCARGHRPGTACPEFQSKFEDLKETIPKTRFCFGCENFEDRTEIDGAVVCAKGHRPRIACSDFQYRRIDIFYTYLYWAHLYSAGKTSEGKEYFEERFSQKFSNQEFAYACLLDYFELNLDDSHFYKCWEIVRKIYEEKLPSASKIFNATLQRFNLDGKRVDLRKVFLDLLFPKKNPESVVKEILEGCYDRRVEKLWKMR